MTRVAHWAMSHDMVQFLKSMAEVETAFGEIREQATSVWPDRAKDVEERLFAAKADADIGHYVDATLECLDLRERVRELAAALPVRHADLQARWRGLAATLPAALASIDGRLSHRTRVPAVVARRWFGTSRARYRDAQAAWGSAQSAARSGRLAEAVTHGEEARRRAVHLADKLLTGS